MTLWQEQSGLCYLCGLPMDWDAPPQAGNAPVLDHDHRCCPYRQHCAICRRGIAHHSCNKLIGLAADNPARLELIAANLRTAITAVDQRMKEDRRLSLPA